MFRHYPDICINIYKMKLIVLFVYLLSLALRSTGLICWECEDAYGHDECIKKGSAVKCMDNQDFCHLELRNGGWGQRFWVEKTCKTKKSCEDNMIQNHRSAWALKGNQVQCNLNYPSSVCRCCCSGDLCNQDQTECDIVSHCPAIIKPRKLKMQCTSGYSLLSQCKFSCRRGFALEGPEMIQCDAFGKWSNKPPKCERVSCRNLLKTPRLGTQECTNGKKLGSKCRFSCNAGYSLKGATMIQCIDDMDGDRYGLWSAMQPRCLPLQCPTLSPIHHGMIKCTKQNYFGSQCTFSCDEHEGYKLYPDNAAEVLTCQSNEDWNNNSPCCTLPCPPSAIMDFVIVMDSSSSVRESGWNKMKEFVISFLKDFRIRDDAVRAAVIRYNTNVDRDSQILLDSYANDKEGFLKAFKNIPYHGSGTRTGRALNYVARTVLRRGNRKLARDIVFVMTDGVSQDRVFFPASRVRRMDALIYVLPIQDGDGRVDMNQIRRIAGPGNEANILTGALTGGFDALNEAFAHNITSLLCHQPCFNPFHEH